MNLWDFEGWVVITFDVLPRFALLAEDSVAIIIGKGADASDCVRFLLGVSVRCAVGMKNGGRELGRKGAGLGFSVVWQRRLLSHNPDGTEIVALAK